ncbi:unnamed protein product, partial [Mesorhabditis belari]|uniref:C3H1-type domain-containing protein n=1 Tax=Mesorhabditis belari TaxID=2138241 RepID=A0AAF3EAB1_9BILA
MRKSLLLREPSTEPIQRMSTLKSALLGGDDSDDSDGEAENEQGAIKETKITKQYYLIQGTSQEQLPSFDPSRNTELECNVFLNDIKREEFLNKKILSQHVSLTEIKIGDDKRKKMGPCRAYKRGDCRRGDKCRFWHALPSEKQYAQPEEAAIAVCEPSLYTSEHDAFKKKKLN